MNKRFVLVLLMILPLSSCAWLEGIFGSRDRIVKFKPGPKMNFDPATGKPNSVKVTLFQLKFETPFKELDYSKLRKGREELGTSLCGEPVSTTIVPDAPADKQPQVTLRLEEDVHFIGVFAEFSEIVGNKYRVCLPVENVKNAVIALDNYEIMLWQ